MDLRAALRLGIRFDLGDLAADEFYTMLVLEEERDRFDREKLDGGRQR